MMKLLEVLEISINVWLYFYCDDIKLASDCTPVNIQRLYILNSCHIAILLGETTSIHMLCI